MNKRSSVKSIWKRFIVVSIIRFIPTNDIENKNIARMHPCQDFIYNKRALPEVFKLIITMVNRLNIMVNVIKNIILLKFNTPEFIWFILVKKLNEEIIFITYSGVKTRRKLKTYSSPLKKNNRFIINPITNATT